MMESVTTSLLFSFPASCVLMKESILYAYSHILPHEPERKIHLGVGEVLVDSVKRRTMDVCTFTSRFFQAATSRRRKPRVKSAKMFSMDGFNYPNLCVDFHSVVK